MAQLKKEVLDWASFLDRAMGDEEFAREIFNEFLNETPRRIDKIHKALGCGNIFDANWEAHTLKGSSANVGANVMQDIANQIEISTRNEDLIKAAILLPILKKEFTILKEEWFRQNSFFR